MRFDTAIKAKRLPLFVLATALIGISSSIAVGLQSSTGKPPAFEVASIKQHDANDRQRSSALYGAGGRFTATNMPLIQIVRIAYKLEPNQVSGGPNWVSSENVGFDIEARAEEGSFPPGQPDRASIEKMQLMLQRLLAQRFSVVVQTEDREQPIYALMVEKGGPKLQKSQRDCNAEAFACHGFAGGTGRGLNFRGVDMTDVAEILSKFTDRPVQNKTGISGIFDFQIPPWVNPTRPQAESFDNGREPAPDPSRPDLFTALQDATGLRLVADKGPVRHLVIESASRPSTN